MDTNNKKSYRDSVSQLTYAIDDSIKKIESIPNFTIGDVSAKTIRDQLLPPLNNAKSRISDIDAVQREIDAIRNEIILPVKEEFKKRERINFVLSIFALFIGIAGIVFATLTTSFFSTQDSEISNAEVLKYLSDTISSEEVQLIECQLYGNQLIKTWQ